MACLFLHFHEDELIPDAPALHQIYKLSMLKASVDHVNLQTKNINLYYIRIFVLYGNIFMLYGNMLYGTFYPTEYILQRVLLGYIPKPYSVNTSQRHNC